MAFVDTHQTSERALVAWRCHPGGDSASAKLPKKQVFLHPGLLLHVFCTVLPPLGLRPLELSNGRLAASPHLGLRVGFLRLYFPAFRSLALRTGQCPSETYDDPGDATMTSPPASPSPSLI